MAGWWSCLGSAHVPSSRPRSPTPWAPSWTASGSDADRRPSIGPRLRLLQLSRQTDEQILTTVSRHQLHADRQPMVVPVQRQRDGGLAADVVIRRERNQRGGESGGAHRILGGGGELAETGRRLTQCRREKD